MKQVALGCGALLVLLLLIVGIGGCSTYNGLVGRSQRVDAEWAQVQNQYQRRSDLIPNLVSTVSGAANFERSTLNDVVQARASVGQVQVNPTQAPTSEAELRKFDQAQGALSSALSRLLVVVERYPELKANANFQSLQAQLEGTENRISVARRDFNEAVREYNTSVKRFPTVLFAGPLGFGAKPYFEAAEGSATPPKVEFNFGKTNPAPQPQ
jgi:LemA protein